MRKHTVPYIIAHNWKRHNNQTVILMKSIRNTLHGPLHAARKMEREPFVIDHCCLTEFEREFMDTDAGRTVKRGIEVHFLTESLGGYVLQDTDTVNIGGTVQDDNSVAGGNEYRVNASGSTETTYGDLFMKVECFYE